MQTDAAGCSDTGVFRNGKVIDIAPANRQLDQQVAGHGQVFGTQTAIVQRNSQRFQLHGRKADIAGLQADDQPGEGVCRDGDGEHGLRGILGYLPVFRHFKGQGSAAIPAGGAQNG